MARRNDPEGRRYLYYAAAATAGGAALYVGAGHLSWLGALFETLGDDTRPGVSFFFQRGELAGDPGLWLKLGLCVAIPAALGAAALAVLAPRLSLRLAGVLAQKWFVILVIVASVAGVAYVGAAVSGKKPLNPEEAAQVFQGKIFSRGKLAAPAPPTEGDLARAFFRAPTEVVRYGRWFSVYPPLPAALLAVGSRLGWPKLPGTAAAAVILVATYAIGRRVLGLFGGAVAAVLAAASPFFLFTQASYLPEATFLAFFASALWAVVAFGERGGAKEAAALGLAAGGAFLVSEYGVLYLAIPFLWYVWRSRRLAGGPGRGRWFAAALAPFLAVWLVYNWRQTGNLFLPPRFFSEITYLGEGYGVREALSAAARAVTVLSSHGFGWPGVCLVPAAVRPFLKPRPDDFEKALYAAVVLTVLASFLFREEGLVSGGRYYYAAWFCLVFITARFFVILGAKIGRRGGEGVAAFAVLALTAVNFAVYLPRAAARYAEGPPENKLTWGGVDVRRAVRDLDLENAVVIVKPRAITDASIPGSPFLDEVVVFARDNGPRNRELIKIFPGREFYLLDVYRFRRTGELEALQFRRK